MMDCHLYCIVTVMLVVMIPAVNPRSLHGPYKRNNKNASPCVGGKWIQVGGFRFWRPKNCILRRQGPLQAMQAANEKGEEENELPSMERGPERGMSYDPTYGYEPYWEDGDWVFDVKPSNKSDANYMCGTRCSRVFTEYGTICGRNKLYEHKTFENYCTLRNEDCSGVLRWMVLYRGPCYRELQEYSRHHVKSAVRTYINEFMSNNPDHPNYVGFCSESTPWGSYEKK